MQNHENVNVRNVSKREAQHNFVTAKHTIVQVFELP